MHACIIMIDCVTGPTCSKTADWIIFSFVLLGHVLRWEYVDWLAKIQIERWRRCRSNVILNEMRSQIFKLHNLKCVHCTEHCACAVSVTFMRCIKWLLFSAAKANEFIFNHVNMRCSRRPDAVRLNSVFTVYINWLQQPQPQSQTLESWILFSSVTLCVLFSTCRPLVRSTKRFLEIRYEKLGQVAISILHPLVRCYHFRFTLECERVPCRCRNVQVVFFCLAFTFFHSSSTVININIKCITQPTSATNYIAANASLDRVSTIK